MGWLEKAKEAGVDQDLLTHFRNPIDFEVIFFYHSNPFSLFTARSLAGVLGRRVALVESSLRSLKKAGFLKTFSRRKNQAPIYYYQPDRRSEKTIAKLYECFLTQKS